MRTQETQAVFDRDIAACRSMEGRDAAFIARAVEMARERHAAYDVMFDAMLAGMRAIQSPVRLEAACKMLLRLGTKVLSGTYEYGVMVRMFTAWGVPRVNGVFEHDRAIIAAMCVHVVEPARIVEEV